MAGFSEYGEYDGLGLAALVKNGDVSPAELLQEALTRTEQLNPSINAVVHLWQDRARRDATLPLPEGPFTGVPFLLKDLIQAFDGTPLTQASRYFKDHRPAHTGELTRRYQRAGLVIFGRSNSSEFGLLPFAEPEFHGPTRNPWNLNYTPGGSSGGAGAAVAAGIVPMGHGGDGGGSIRIPASCNGLFGMKPSRGRMPTGPDYSIHWQGFAVEHVLTRSVRDSAAMLDATAGEDSGAPYAAPAAPRSFLQSMSEPPPSLRIGFCIHPMMGSGVHPDVEAAVTEAAHLAESLGHRVEEFVPDGVDFTALGQSFLTVLATEIAANVFQSAALVGKTATPRDTELPNWMFAKIGHSIPGDVLCKAISDCYHMGRVVARWQERFDVLLTPTLAAPPVEVGALQPRPLERWIFSLARHLPLGPVVKGIVPVIARRSFDWVAYTPVANMAGVPAMSVPLYWNSEGLPIGTHWMGRFGDEATLFKLARQLEEARPWSGRRPVLGKSPPV